MSPNILRRPSSRSQSGETSGGPNQVFYGASGSGTSHSDPRWAAILRTLGAWAIAPVQPADHEFTPPVGWLVEAASDYALQLRASGEQAPDFVVPDGDGGLAFEWRAGTATRSLAMERDGSVVLLSFQDGKLEREQDRGRLPKPQVPPKAGQQEFLSFYSFEFAE